MAVPYLLYLYVVAVCLSVSITQIILALIALIFLMDWWLKKKALTVQKDFSLFAFIYGWKGVSLIANGLFFKVVRVKEIWYKMPYLIIGSFSISRKQLHIILNVLFATNAILALYAVGQKYFHFPVVYKPMFAGERLAGYLENPDYYAGHVTLVLMLCLSLTLFYRSRFVVYLPFLLVGVVLSGSRTYLITVSACVLILAYRKSRRAFLYIVTVLPLVLLAGLAYMPIMSERFSASLLLTDSNTRFSYWSVAWSVFKENPVFGIGFKEFFLTHVHPYVAAGILPHEGNAHNLYLHELAEGGIVGLLLVIFVMAYFVRKYSLSYRKNNDQLLSGMSMGISFAFLALIFSGIPEAHFEFPAVWLLLTFLMGICEAYKNGLNSTALQAECRAGSARRTAI